VSHTDNGPVRIKVMLKGENSSDRASDQDANDHHATGTYTEISSDIPDLRQEVLQCLLRITEKHGCLRLEE
jgi:hypothetical protein